MNHESQSTININKSLVAAVAETRDVIADSTNPFHKSKYASLSAHLAALKPIFAKHGLAVIQFPAGSLEGVGVTTRIIHVSGEFIERTILVPVFEKNIKGQDVGALVSYARRYALASVAGVATEDDDAESDRISHTPTQQSKSVVTSNFIPNPAAQQAPAAPVASGNIAPNAFPIEDVPDIDSVLMPFGKNKGTPLSSLTIRDWEWIVNKMELKPFNGKISSKDIKLKNTARILLERSNSGANEMDEVPF